MLDALRSRASSWVVKVLLGLLVLSFVIWGIGDVFRNTAPRDTVAKVDGLPVSTASVEREARARMNQLQQQMGGRLPVNPTIMNSMRQQALQGAIARRLLDAHAADLNLVVPDELLVKTVRDEPTFQANGQFDRSRFELYLQQVGFNEADFFSQLRGDIMRGDLVGALTSGLRGSETVAGVLAAYRDEQRSGQALVVPAARMQVPDPDDQALQTWLDAHKDQYQAPEYRKVEIVIADPQALAREQQIDDAQIQAEYDAHRADYTKAETRTGQQLLASDQAVLDDAAARVAGGAGFADVAAALKDKGVTLTPLGPVSKGQIPEVLEEQLWSLKPNETGKPVQDEFGWHLLQLTAVTPEEVTPLAQVKEQIRQQLALRKAGEALPDIANQLDDALAGGASLQDAAGRVGLEVQTIPAIDRQGQAPDGQKVATPALSPRMLEEAFATQEGQTSLLITDDDGRYFVLAVSSIQPARTQTLAEARPELLADWRRAQQSEAAKKLAQDLLAKAKGGASLASLADPATGVELRPLGPTTRTPGKDAEPAAEGSEALFQAPAGQFVPDVVALRDGSAVVLTEKVTPAPAKAGDKALLDEQTAGLGNDVIQDYEAALRQRYSIQTYPQAIAALMQSQEAP